jgi:hypothetical protein
MHRPFVHTAQDGNSRIKRCVALGLHAHRKLFQTWSALDLFARSASFGVTRVRCVGGTSSESRAQQAGCPPLQLHGRVAAACQVRALGLPAANGIPARLHLCSVEHLRYRGGRNCSCQSCLAAVAIRGAACLQAAQATECESVVDKLYTWVVHQSCVQGGAACKVPVAFMYADGIHNTDSRRIFDSLSARLRAQSRRVAELPAAVLTSKNGLSKVAAALWLQALPGVEVARSATLDDLGAALLHVAPQTQRQRRVREEARGVRFCALYW